MRRMADHSWRWRRLSRLRRFFFSSARAFLEASARTRSTNSSYVIASKVRRSTVIRARFRAACSVNRQRAKKSGVRDWRGGSYSTARDSSGSGFASGSTTRPRHRRPGSANSRVRERRRGRSRWGRPCNPRPDSWHAAVRSAQASANPRSTSRGHCSRLGSQGSSSPTGEPRCGTPRISIGRRAGHLRLRAE